MVLSPQLKQHNVALCGGTCLSSQDFRGRGRSSSELMDSLDYRVSSRTTLHSETLSQKAKTGKKKEEKDTNRM